MFLLLVIVLIVLAMGGWGYSRYGYGGLSPVAVILLALIILWYTGHLRLH